MNQSNAIEGTIVAHYRVLSRIGAGGMGEVYLARDTKLERTVALKVLPSDMIRDKERMARFVQEAKTASALNHPNIITIHEIGQVGEIMYIATEFIEGDTLRQYMNKTTLTVSEALETAIQVASALAAAHEAGIVHRDIKPENLMLRRDGILKVLDFGVAKLNDTSEAAVDRDAQTINLVETAPGTLLGTAAYMSPEQARGREIDGRTDVWSLGVVLYEMVTGIMPFEHETPSDVIAAILRSEPAPMSSLNPEVPPELERIVSKALEKNREERYQGVKDLVVDLRRLKKHLEFESELESLNSSRSSGITGSRNSGYVSHSGSKNLQRTTISRAEHATSSAEYLVSSIKRHKRSALLLFSLVVIAVVAGGYSLFRFSTRGKTPGLQVMKVSRFTATGKAVHAAISPDGNYVAHVSEDGGQQSVWIGQVAAASQVQIIPPAAVRYVGLTFSQDGNFLYFVQADKDNPRGALFQIPALGGAARHILTNLQSPVGISPDGKRLAFVRNLSPKENSLIVSAADGTDEKQLATRKSPDFISTEAPAWSPDSNVIAYVYSNTSGGYYENVIGVHPTDGKEAPITNQRWWHVGQVAWRNDGMGLMASATEDAGSLAQLWYLPYQGGEAKRITSDLNGYADVNLTRDSRTLLSVRSDRLVNVWTLTDLDSSNARQVTSGFERDDGMRGITWTPDGRIVYRSVAGGEPNIWIMKPDGSAQKQLTINSTQNFDPMVSPDGRVLVWAGRRTGNTNLWRMDLDGSNPKQITSGVGEYLPDYTPDGQWILYTAYDPVSGFWSIWKIPAEGGSPTRLTEKESAVSSVSPDGQFFACNYQDKAGEPYIIAVVPIGGGQPAKTFNIPGSFGRDLHWTADGRALTYSDTQGGVSNLWSQSLAGGTPKKLTDFKEQRIFGFAWSRDGKQLAISRGVVNTDVVLIKDFLP